MKNAIISFFALFFLSIALLRGVSSPIEDTPKDDNLITEGEVTVTSLEELKRYTDAGLFSQSQYYFYYDLISDDGEHEEFHSVNVSEYTIRFEPTDDYYLFKSTIEFTVAESDLDTLPIGTYRKELSDGVVLFFDDVEDTEDTSIYEIPEVKKLQAFICATYIWNTPEYGKGVDYPGIYNYICIRYGDNQSISAEDFCRIAKEEFGLEDGEKYLEENGIMWDGKYSAGGIGGITAFRVEEVADDENTVTVIVQYYSDRTWLLKSHKVAYKLGKDGKWLGYTILEEGRYQPLDFRYIEDSMGEKITSVPYHIYADEAAGEQVILLAQYGESIGKSADGKIYAGTDGTRHDVFGIYNSNTQSFGYFSIYHVRSSDGEIEYGCVVGEDAFEDYTTQSVLSGGQPTEIKEGKYNNKLFSPGIGLVERTIEFTADGKIYLEEKCETDSSFGGTYKGTYKSDKQTGELVLTLTPVSLNSGAEADNKELKVVGKLLSCGRTCFIPLESELPSLSPDFPLPLIFVPKHDEMEPEQPIAFLETDQFMDCFVRFFHDEYTYGDELKGNVLYAMSLLCVNAAYNDKPTFSILENVGDPFGTIKQSDLEHVTEMILGPNVDLTKYHTTFIGTYDGYFSEEKAYHFSYGRDTWNDDPCGIDRSSVQVTETDESLVYTATVNLYEMWFSDIIAETKNLTYTFEKNVSDGLMYYKLISIKEN